MDVALRLGRRALGTTAENPNVGCVIVKDGRLVGVGWTQPGGRPHAEAMALAQAGSKAAGATIYVTLEPCAHPSERGPACAHLVYDARPARVVGAVTDPDPRTAGQGFARLRETGIEVETGVMASEARVQLAGFFSRLERSRPFVTLKMATSLDGQIAMANGQSRWITGDAARAHGRYPLAAFAADAHRALGHELAEELRALAAAEDQQVEAVKGGVRCGLLIQRDVAHRVAGEGELILRFGRQA